MNYFKKYIPLLLILAVVTVLFLFRLNRDLLGDWDECVIATQAREMKNTGNFITNQFNGILLLEKPMANNWWMQIPLLFSNSEFAYRFSSVAFSMLTITLIYIFCLNYFSLFVAVTASLLLFTNWIFVDFSSKVNTDMGFTFFAFLGVYLWILSYKKSSMSYLSGFAFGLAVLTKGLSIFPYIGAIVVWELFGKVPLSEKLLRMTKLSIIFLLTILPWHIYHYLKYGQTFIDTYFIQHLFNRSKYPLDFHNEGRLFYLKLILKDFNVWLLGLLAIPVSLYKGFNDCHSRSNRESRFFRLDPRIREDDRKGREGYKENVGLIILILLLIFLPLISITTVRTRIAWYALPIYPFISIAIAFGLDKLISFLKFKYKNILYGLILLILSGLAIFMIDQKMRLLDSVRVIAPRDEIFLKSQSIEASEINYLVWESERIAESILPKTCVEGNMCRTNTTFMFGGNPCAVFYSNKKIVYFYSIEKFAERFMKGDGYFAIYKDDLKYIEKYKYAVVFKNNDYYLLKY